MTRSITCDLMDLFFGCPHFFFQKYSRARFGNLKKWLHPKYQLKTILHNFSHVITDVFSRKIFDHYPKKVKIEISSLKFLPVQKIGFQESACSKDRQDRSRPSPGTWAAWYAQATSCSLADNQWTSTGIKYHYCISLPAPIFECSLGRRPVGVPSCPDRRGWCALLGRVFHCLMCIWWAYLCHGQMLTIQKGQGLFLERETHKAF